MFYLVLLGLNMFYLVLPGFNIFYLVLPGFYMFYLVLPGFDTSILGTLEAPGSADEARPLSQSRQVYSACMDLGESIFQ